MPDDTVYLSIDELYDSSILDESAINALLEQSLHPRPSTMLFDKMAALGVDQSHRILDIGCRDGRHAIELCKRFGCCVVAVDPVVYNLKQGSAQVLHLHLEDRVTLLFGRIESIPAREGDFDFIWCRDMLNHVRDLRYALSECMRVLRPGGFMLVYQTFATDLLEPREAARLYPPLAIIPENMSTSYFEAVAQRTGFTLVERDTVGSEWREHWEEDGTRLTSNQLLHIARLRRRRDDYVQTLGRKAYESELANCYWGVYQMLGKLCPQVYVLQKPAPAT